MTEIKDLVGTAFIVAEYRARENEEPDPLYSDPIVPLFLDEETRAAADRMSGGLPAQDGVRIRTRYLDDRLYEYLDRGYTQIVILGSGLDTRAVRKQTPGVTYFEIDDDSILDFKQERLKEAGIEADVVFIPGDYIADGLLALLTANGFDPKQPAYFIWEGNTMYLSRTAALQVLTELRDNVETFAISFDYVSEAIVNHTTGNERLASLVKRFAEMGAVFTYGIDDVEPLAREAGLEVADAVKTASLFRTYWPDREIDWNWYDNYTMCTLRTPPR